MNPHMNFGETVKMKISDLIQDCPIILVEEDEDGGFHNYELKLSSFSVHEGRNIMAFVKKDKEVCL